MYSITPYCSTISEMDGMGIMHHTNYGKLFERGRIEFLRLAGISYAAISKQNIHFPVLRMECTYREAVEFDQNLAIETFLRMLTKTRLGFSYNLFKTDTLQTPELREKKMEGISPCAQGYTEHCCLSSDRKPRTFPEDIFNILKKYVYASKE